MIEKGYRSESRLRLLIDLNVTIYGSCACCPLLMLSSSHIRVIRTELPLKFICYDLFSCSFYDVHSILFIRTEFPLKSICYDLFLLLINRVADQAKRRSVTTSEPTEDCYDLLFEDHKMLKRKNQSTLIKYLPVNVIVVVTNLWSSIYQSLLAKTRRSDWWWSYISFIQAHPPLVSVFVYS
ncbi:hypothetical protein Syun_003267 [Stephania yunnanensis]|uniref:Uncharacterized protein n=1 Tax=Stephania yunnanensis TaxID=152371 RepID=A0AAP0L1X0_9MAGN